MRVSASAIGGAHANAERAAVVDFPRKTDWGNTVRAAAGAPLPLPPIAETKSSRAPLQKIHRLSAEDQARALPCSDRYT